MKDRTDQRPQMIPIMDMQKKKKQQQLQQHRQRYIEVPNDVLQMRRELRGRTERQQEVAISVRAVLVQVQGMDQKVPVAQDRHRQRQRVIIQVTVAFRH